MVGLGLLTVVLLSLSFPPMDLWPLAYIALVPWLISLDTESSRRWELLWAVLAGALFWAVNLYWLWWITLVGYAALVVYLSSYWLVTALLCRAAIRRGFSMWLVLPVVWVALEYARAYIISGFPWFFLAHSQYARTELIQICDLTGQYGVSFFVAMVNGAVFDWIRSLRKPDVVRVRLWTRRMVSAVAPLLVAGAMIGYGYWRLRQIPTSTRPGPILAVVQHAFAVTLSGRDASSEKIFADHIQSTEKLVGETCDLVIWPETVLPMGLNPELLDLQTEALSEAELRCLGWQFFGPTAGEVKEEHLRGILKRIIHGPAANEDTLRKQAEHIGQLSRALGCPILAGGASLHRNAQPIDESDHWVTRNSALWFDRTWRASTLYSKNHLVPFGEYVPFKQSWTGLHKALRWFVPSVMSQLDPGPCYRRFDLTRQGRHWTLATPICYEGTFARLCRKLVMNGAEKRTDVLVNLSNDGWFVYRWGGGSYQGSSEHPQHLVQYCFRAVENRVPVIRAVNTGISASINSNGQIEAEISASIDSSGRIVAKVAWRGDGCEKNTMVSGTLLLNGQADDNEDPIAYAPEVLVDHRVAVYSLVGDIFAQAVSLAAAVLAGWLCWRARREREKNTKSQEKSVNVSQP